MHPYTSKLITLLLATLFTNLLWSKTINIIDRGAQGDGKYDNWEIIQRAIDEITNEGGGTLYFPKGQYAIYDKSLVIWGSNVTLEGESKSVVSIIKKGKVGYFGDCIDIAGKINGYKYFGNFGYGNYKALNVYSGQTIKAENIFLKNLTIDSQLSDSNIQRIFANNLGIINVDTVTINDCIIQNASQTNVGIVNDTKQFTNENVIFNNCTFQNSGQHNVRVISYNQGEYIGNTVQFNKCKFLTVLSADIREKELNGDKTLLWYRGSAKSRKSSVSIDSCYFDESGIIFVNANANGFSIRNSNVRSALNIQHARSFDKTPQIIIHNTTFGLINEQAVWDKKMKQYPNNNSRNGFNKTTFGSVYPATLVITQ